MVSIALSPTCYSFTKFFSAFFGLTSLLSCILTFGLLWIFDTFSIRGSNRKTNIQKLSCNTLRIQSHVIEINDNQGEVLPIMAYTGRKGIPFFSGFRYIKEPLWVGTGAPIWKGNVFTSWNIWNGREICVCGKQKRSKRANRWILWL